MKSNDIESTSTELTISSSEPVQEQHVDYLFMEETRKTVLPIIYPSLWANYKKQAGCFWQRHEVDLSRDKVQWDALDEQERYFLEMVLGFFASGDLLVNKNLSDRFLNEIQKHEVQIGYSYQRMMENIHSEMYAALIDSYITDLDNRDKLFNAIQRIPVIKKISNWVNAVIESSKSYDERLIAFAAFEGIMFSGPFCAIFWIREKGILQGLTKSNDFISRDEGLHVEFAVEIHKLLKIKASNKSATDIISEAVNLSIEFIVTALPCSLIGINAANMVKYIKYVANRLMTQLGYDPIYANATQPFEFMERIGLVNKSNFFENKPTEYSRAEVEEKKESTAYDELLDAFNSSDTDN